MEKEKNMASAYEKTVDIIDHSKDMPAEEAIDALIRCVKAGYNLAFEKAIHALADIDHPSVVPALIRLYDWFQADSRKRDRSCDARTAIVEALGCTGSTQSISLLKKAARTVERAKLGPRIEDAAISLRAAAALALAKVDPDCLYELAVLLFDEKPDVPVSTANRPYEKSPVRRAAAQAIGILGDAGGMALLAVKLRFPNGEVPDVIAECLEALISMRPPYLIEVVKPYLMGFDHNLSAIAAISLSESLGFEVIDLLYETLEHVSDGTKESILVAICMAAKGHRIKEILLNFLDHPNEFVRLGAVKQIKNHLDDEVLRKLRQMRDTDPEISVRLEAALD